MKTQQEKAKYMHALSSVLSPQTLPKGVYQGVVQQQQPFEERNQLLPILCVMQACLPLVQPSFNVAQGE